MSITKDVERLEEILEVSGPPSDQDLLACLASFLSMTRLGVFLGSKNEAKGPHSPLVCKLVELARQVDQDEWLIDYNDAQIAREVIDLLPRSFMWRRPDGLKEIVDQIKPEHFVDYIERHPDVVELIKSLPCEDQTMADLTAKLDFFCD